MQTRTTYQRFFRAGHSTERGRRRSPLRLVSLLALAFVSACAAGQQSTYKLGLSEPHLPVLCRVYLNSALTNIVDIKTTAGDCFAVTNRLQAWSMEAFVERDGKLIPAAEYLQRARQAGQPARVPATDGDPQVSVFGRFTAEGAWEGKSWEERVIPRFVDLDNGLQVLPSYGFFAEGPGAASRSSDGWFRIRLYPGSYVVGLAPRFENPRRSFRVDVPADAKDLYIGSFRIKCVGRERGLGVYPLSCSDDVAVTMEKSVAVQRMDVDAGTLVSVPADPYGGTAEGASAALPKQVQLRKRWRVTVPDWSRFAVTESYEVSYPTAGDAVAGLGVAAAGGAVEGLIVGTGAIVPLAALALASGRDRLNRWTPCVTEMHMAIQDADLEATFRDRLNVHSRTSSAGTDAAGWLSADIQRVILRKCTAPKTYCIEVSIRIRVHRDGETAYDRVHVYSSREGRYGEERWPGHDYWEAPVEPVSTCREIGDYCGAEGQQRAVREVETALDAIAAAVARNLSGSSTTPRS